MRNVTRSANPRLCFRELGHEEVACWSKFPAEGLRTATVLGNARPRRLLSALSTGAQRARK